MAEWAYMHVPKTGGTAFASALTRALGVDRSPARFDRTLFGRFDRFSDLAPEIRRTIVVHPDEARALRDFGIVAGHFSLPTLCRVTSQDRIVTILREPRARLLSQYAFWRLQTEEERRHWAPYRLPDAARSPLAEFLANAEVASSVDNVLCRLTLGDDPRLPIDGFCAPADRAAVARDTRDRLCGLRYVGLLEQGARTVSELSGVVGRSLELGRENVTRGRDAPLPPPPGLVLDGSAAGLLAERTACDRLVYEDFAARFYESRTAARSASEAAFALQLRILAAQLRMS